MTLREELIQVAAVAAAIVHDLDLGSTGAEIENGYLGTIAGDIMNERGRQEAKWGPQHHTPAEWLAILAEEVGEAATETEEEDNFNWGVMRASLENAESYARSFLKARFGPDEVAAA